MGDRGDAGRSPFRTPATTRCTAASACRQRWRAGRKPQFLPFARKTFSSSVAHFPAFGIGGDRMDIKRREVVLGGIALLAVGSGVTPARAQAAAYFAGTAVDNGVTWRTTDFARIDRRWHKQMVKYKSSEPAGTV